MEIKSMNQLRLLNVSKMKRIPIIYSTGALSLS